MNAFRITKKSHRSIAGYAVRDWMQILFALIVGASLFSCQQLQTTNLDIRHQSEERMIVEILTKSDGLVKLMPLQDGVLSLVMSEFGNGEEVYLYLEEYGGAAWWHQNEITKGVPFELDIHEIAAFTGHAFEGAPKQEQEELEKYEYGIFYFEYKPSDGWKGTPRENPSVKYVELHINHSVNWKESVLVPQYGKNH